MTVGTKDGVRIPVRPDPPVAISPAIKIPDHLLPVLCKIAQRQRTTLAAVVAQALSDYCAGGL
jgi:hypothetical protein